MTIYVIYDILYQNHEKHIENAIHNLCSININMTIEVAITLAEKYEFSKLIIHSISNFNFKKGFFLQSPLKF